MLTRKLCTKVGRMTEDMDFWRVTVKGISKELRPLAGMADDVTGKIICDGIEFDKRILKSM